MPRAYKLPFWCGEARPTGPNADVPAKPIQTEVLGSAASWELGGRQMPGEAHVGWHRFAATPFGSGLSSPYALQWW